MSTRGCGRRPMLKSGRRRWSADGLSHATIRNYQQTVALFVAYLCDRRYGWAEVCEARFGSHPTLVFHEWNTAVHRNDAEGRPGNRPLYPRRAAALLRLLRRAEWPMLRAMGRKGWLAAFRDAVLFKSIYAWGLRRREAAMLDVADWSANARAPEFGRLRGVIGPLWQSHPGEPTAAAQRV